MTTLRINLPKGCRVVTNSSVLATEETKLILQGFWSRSSEATRRSVATQLVRDDKHSEEVGFDRAFTDEERANLERFASTGET